MTKAIARLCLATSALALAACGAEQAEAPPAPAASPTATAAAPDTPPKTPIANAIPARFIGVWDGESGTCDPASDLRLDIAATTIGFYESRGTVTRLTEAEDGSAIIDLAMEGEGDQWSATIKLELIGTGAAQRLLNLPDPDSDILLRPMRLKRCPA